MFEQLEVFVRRTMSTMETREDAQLFMKVLERHIRNKHGVSVEELIAMLEEIDRTGRDSNGVVEKEVLEKIRFMVPELKFVMIIAKEA